MRDAAKMNIDNTTATEADEEWCRKFLYPDLRPAYMLKDNPQNIKHALDLCAKVRAATLAEVSHMQSGEAEVWKQFDKVMDEVDTFHKTVDKFSSGKYTQQESRIYRRTGGPISPDPANPIFPSIRNWVRENADKIRKAFNK